MLPEIRESHLFVLEINSKVLHPPDFSLETQIQCYWLALLDPYLKNRLRLKADSSSDYLLSMRPSISLPMWVASQVSISAQGYWFFRRIRRITQSKPQLITPLVTLQEPMKSTFPNISACRHSSAILFSRIGVYQNTFDITYLWFTWDEGFHWKQDTNSTVIICAKFHSHISIFV